MHSVQGPIRIQVRDQITLRLVTIAFRSMTRTRLGQGPNHTLASAPNCFWVRNQIESKPETKSHLGQRHTCFWFRDQIAFRSGSKSHLGQEPKVEGTNRIWVRNQIALDPETKLPSGQGPNRICAGDLFAFRSVTET